MNAKLIGSATAMLALGMMSGCASSPRTAASMEMQPLSSTCNRPTGSRVVSPRERTDCGPVGYPFSVITAEQFASTGQTSWSSVIRPNR